MIAILIRLLLMSIVANKLLGSLSSFKIRADLLSPVSSMPLISEGDREKKATSELLTSAEPMINATRSKPSTSKVELKATKGKKAKNERKYGLSGSGSKLTGDCCLLKTIFYAESCAL